MATRGSLGVEVDAKSSAEKMWKILSDPITYFPKILPDYYKSVQLIHGTAMAPGTVVFITYGKDFPVKTATEKITAVDEKNMSFSYSVIGGMEDLYKTLEGTFLVIPKGEGCTVKFSCQFEKTNETIPDPVAVKDFKVKNIEDIDAYLLSKS